MAVIFVSKLTYIVLRTLSSSNDFTCMVNSPYHHSLKLIKKISGSTNPLSIFTLTLSLSRLHLVPAYNTLYVRLC